MSKATEFLTKLGLTSETEACADRAEMIADFDLVYQQYKAGTLDTNAKIGAEIKKAFVRQANRDARAVAREAAKAK